MSTRHTMAMRADLERDQQTATDSWNLPDEPNWQPLATVACYAWNESRGQQIDGEKTAVLESISVVVPKATDVAEGDRIANIKDRLGSVLFPGPLLIESAARRPDHIKLGVSFVG